jgi:serine protease
MLQLSLLLILFLPRPECPPLTELDFQRLLTLDSHYQTAFTSQPDLPATVSYRSDRLVIGFEPERLTPLISRLDNLNLDITVIEPAAGFLVVRLKSPESLEVLKTALSNLPGIRFLEPDCPVQALTIPNDPMFLTRQWDKWVMYADLAWDIITGGTIKVAVVDNGVEYYHPDLAANFRSGEPGYDFIANDNDPRPDNPGIENAFHGTHVAGIIAAVSNNLTGIAGWAQIQLLAVRVLNDSGSGNLSDVARGIRWAADNGAKVINLSLGGDAASTVLIEACQYAVNRGALLVAASGNDGRSGITYPARLNECIAVGATDENSELAWFSNYGPEQELVAPGTGIYSTAPGGSYLEASGTSMSCPQVSGVAVLIFAVNPALTVSQVRAILAAGAIDMGDIGRDHRYGYGLVNAYRSLQLARQLVRFTTKTTAPDSRTPGTVIAGRTLNLPESQEIISVFNPAGMLVARIPPRTRKITLPAAGTYLLQTGTGENLPRLLKIIVTD